MSSGTRLMCSLCHSRPINVSCEGCQKKLCHPCSITHHDDLMQSCEELINRRNELHEQITHRSTDNDNSTHPAFNEVDQWEKRMKTEISRIATSVRDQIRQCLAESNQQIQNKFTQISKDLEQMRKTESITEKQLDRIKLQLQEIDESIQQSNQKIRVDTSQTALLNLQSLIFVARDQDHRRTNSQTVNNPPAYPPPPTSNGRTQQSATSTNNRTPNYSPYYRREPEPQQNYSRPDSRGSQLSATSSQVPRRYSTNSYQRPRTYQCVGCKTMNTINDYGDNSCSVCHSPAWL